MSSSHAPHVCRAEEANSKGWPAPELAGTFLVVQASGGETPLEKQAGLFEAPKAGTGPGLGTSSSSATATAPPPQQPEGPSAEETKASMQGAIAASSPTAAL